MFMETGGDAALRQKLFMAQMELQSAESKKTRRRIHHSLRIDMTPMVDLGFLLISFFIFTTTLTEKNGISLMMPKASTDSMEVKASTALTILLGGNNQVLAYEGSWKDAVANNRIITSNFTENDGIGMLIREKQKKLEQTNLEDGRDALVLLIKSARQASYKNIIDAIDEATINNVTKYALLDATAEERKRLMER
jgi:biopolymer transport protein ExbD